MHKTNHIAKTIKRLILAGVFVPLGVILLALCLPFAVIWATPYAFDWKGAPEWYLKSITWVDVKFTKAFEVLGL